MAAKEIQGIGYDFDGTIISTLAVHEEGWRYAGEQMNTPIPEEFLLQQKGLTNGGAGQLIFGNNSNKASRFASLKAQFVVDHSGEMPVFEGFFETVENLTDQGIQVMICTSADHDFVEKVFKTDDRFEAFRARTVTREMYQNGKPSPEPLLLTFSKMGVSPESAIYIGDAFSDYLASTAAGSSFVYFCPDLKKRDPKIPEEITTITKHEELLHLIKGD